MSNALNAYTAEPTDFHERVNRLMWRRGMTHKQLSMKSGIVSANLTNLLSGKNKPSYENFIKIADALGTTLDYLAGRTKEQT